MLNLRLIPVVLFATASLFVLKAAGFLDAEGFRFDSMRGAQAQGAVQAAPLPPAEAAHRRSWAQEMLNYPDITGSIGGKPAAPAKSAPLPAATPVQPPSLAAIKPADKPISPGERAVLDRLQDRRKELDVRSHQLEIREGLVKAAEKRIAARIGELKALEAKIKSTMREKDDAEAARFKGLVAMYENMKPKDAARIFDRLDLKVLIDVASQIKPRTMSEILAKMSPEIAERLTVELATRPGGPLVDGFEKLPKIQGKPRT
jgi:flagellar motility protein MotE (MotC chaperone)